MHLNSIESLLERKIGLSTESLGADTIAKAVQRRMRACGLEEGGDYLNLLSKSRDEWEELVETVVVPETWFFRNRKSFAYLSHYARHKWLPANDDDILRVLSIASSSGEEPYSISMTLLDAGLQEGRFSVIALDISKKTLEKARAGFYGPESFRGEDLWFRERYFDARPEGYQLHPSVMNTVQFVRGNILDGQVLSGDTAYDIIFCRNLLIYLSPKARDRVMEVIDRLLARGGILFVGHAERTLAITAGLEMVGEAGVFALTRQVAAPKPKWPVRPRPLVGFERRRHTQGKPSASRKADVPPDLFTKTGQLNHKSYPVKDRRRPPDEEAGLLEQARALADKGALEKASKLCDKVLDRDMVHVQAHYLKGLICLAMDKEKDAEEWLNKAVYLDPHHYEALNHLALVAEHRGDRERSAQLRQRVKRIRQKEGIS